MFCKYSIVFHHCLVNIVDVCLCLIFFSRSLLLIKSSRFIRSLFHSSLVLWSFWVLNYVFCVLLHHDLWAYGKYCAHIRFLIKDGGTDLYIIQRTLWSYTEVYGSIAVNSCQIKLPQKDIIFLSEISIMIYKAGKRTGVENDKFIHFTK